MRTNKIILDIPNDQITISKQRTPYISKVNTPPQLEVRRANSFLLRADNKGVIFPGGFIEVRAPDN